MRENPRHAHDLECSSVIRQGLPCSCAVGCWERLKAWNETTSQEDTAELIKDARHFMRRLIELFNEAHHPDLR